MNLTVEELRAEVLEPWGRDEPVALGERSWRASGGAQLTVIEGPEVPVGSLTMGRGWSVALREGREVTRELLGSTGRGAGGKPAGAAGRPGGVADPVLADALGLDLIKRLGEGPVSLQEVWRLAGERDPERAPAAGLELARAAVISLSRSRLAVLERIEDRQPRELTGEELEEALDAVESWGAAALRLRRA